MNKMVCFCKSQKLAILTLIDRLSHLDVYTLLSPPHESYSSLLVDFMDKQMRKALTKPLLVAIVVDWTTSVKSWAREIAEWIIELQVSLQKIDHSVLNGMKEKRETEFYDNLKS